MGMDVYGKAPANAAGEYFRNNCWWWRPLWGYIEWEAPLLAIKVPNAQSNDGDGLGAGDSEKLAAILRNAIATGRTKEYADRYEKLRKALPLEKCDLCHGTGKRTDMVVENGCNACKGLGKKESWAAHYPFIVENVEAFALFLENCGGFEIN